MGESERRLRELEPAFSPTPKPAPGLAVRCRPGFSARGPYLLCLPRPDASLPCAGQCGAGTQTGVTTAPKAASLCSSRSREGPASPPSSLSDPPSQGLVGSSTGPSPPPPHARSPPPPSCARGPVTQLVSLQSESLQVASSPCGWSLPFSCCQGGSASPLTPPGLSSGLFCSFSEDCL